MIPTKTLPARCDAGTATLRCYEVRTGVYRTEVLGLGGGLVDDLSRSYPTPREALHHYDVARALFDSGLRIVEVIDLVHLLNTQTPPPAGAATQGRRPAGTTILPCEEEDQ